MTVIKAQILADPLTGKVDFNVQSMVNLNNAATWKNGQPCLLLLRVVY